MNIPALFLFLITFVVAFAYHRHTNVPTPPTVSWVYYINNRVNWNAWGHFLAQYSIALTLGLTLTFWPWWYFAIPSILIALIVEFVIQKNTLKELDTWFDLFTHIAGGVCASFMLNQSFYYFS